MKKRRAIAVRLPAKEAAAFDAICEEIKRERAPSDTSQSEVIRLAIATLIEVRAGRPRKAKA